MTPTERPPAAPPLDPTVRVQSQRPPSPSTDARGGSSGGRVLAIGLLLLSVTLVSAGIGFVVSGGRLPSAVPADGPAATPAAQTAPPLTPAATQPTGPAPAVPPIAAPIAALQPEPGRATSVPRPAAQPTAAAPPPTSPPTTKPAGRDPRLAQVEGTIREYFAALNAQDYARAHQVCCTEAWRARYPLDRWERNFDGVSDLKLVGEPRHLRVEPDVIFVDTDYTFKSGGRQRHFTLRWTFQPVGDRWQAELAEAFAR